MFQSLPLTESMSVSCGEQPPCSKSHQATVLLLACRVTNRLQAILARSEQCSIFIICTALILPTGELCFEPVVFNRRQHQLQDLMGGLLPLSALSAYRDPHMLHVFL